MLVWPPIKHDGRRLKATMKSPKRIAAILIAGFFAFAPPGTMIFLMALVVGFAGRRWAAGAAVLCVCAGAAFLLLRRKRHRALVRDGASESTETN